MDNKKRKPISAHDMENKKVNKPFYALPEKIPTSAQIVNAARSSLRTFDTRRPNTPRDDQRHLFPSSTNRTPESRPPSAFSLNSRHFDGPDSRPVSGTRLSPLDHPPKTITPADLENIHVPRPPSDTSKSGTRRGSANRPKGITALGQDGGDGPQSPSKPALEDGVVPDYLTSPGDHVQETAGRAPPSVPMPSSAGSDTRSGSAGSRKSSAGKSSRTSSAGKRDPEEVEDLYTSEIEPLVKEMANLTKKKDCERIHELAEQLYSALEFHNCLTKQFPHRSHILKIIFKLLDVDEPRVLLRLARLILAFKVSGNNMLNVCKLVFKVSRNDKNDSYFLEENILNLLLETIRNTDPASSCEALVYCVGSIKFLTGNPDILKRLARLDGIKTLAILLHAINKNNRENGKVNDQYGHILVQLAAALRNLADLSSGRDRFLSHKVVEGLVVLLDSYPGDADLMLYISRILSKITLHTDCCSLLADQQSCYKAIIKLLKKHILNDDLIVRICFVLGNLTIKNDNARLKLFKEPDCLVTLLSILKKYLDLDLEGKTTASRPKDPQINEGQGGKEKDSEISKVEDVLIKVMRVLANLSINEEVGPAIARNQDYVDILLKVVENKEVSQHEELVVNAIVAINNVSYFTSQDSSRSSDHKVMAESLLKLILTNNMEGILEASRVFGNLTRHKHIRDFLSENKDSGLAAKNNSFIEGVKAIHPKMLISSYALCMDAMMVTLLDSGNREIVYIACGVLINFMLDEEKRPLLKQEGGVKKLIEVLRDFGREDWQLSGCVCKVLVNYSSKIHSSENSFGKEEATTLSDLLVEYLDKDSALVESYSDAADEEMREYVEDCWHDEFYPVGSQLLKRIESHMSPLEPLEAPS